jgi:hypothetical protein
VICCVCDSVLVCSPTPAAMAGQPDAVAAELGGTPGSGQQLISCIRCPQLSSSLGQRSAGLALYFDGYTAVERTIQQRTINRGYLRLCSHADFAKQPWECVCCSSLNLEAEITTVWRACFFWPCKVRAGLRDRVACKHLTCSVPAEQP